MSSSELLNPLGIDAELADRLEKDAAFRDRYIRMFAQSEVAAEIKGLRKRRRLRQAEVAALAGTGQSAISRIQKSDYDAWTFKTLIQIAAVLKARLRISFQPIEDVISGYRVEAQSSSDVSMIDGASTDYESAVGAALPPAHLLAQSGDGGAMILGSFWAQRPNGSTEQRT